MDKSKKALLIKKLDSILYHVDNLKDGIDFFKKFGFRVNQVREDIGWCNLHMEEDDLCVDLSTKIPVSGEPHYLVDNVQEFYRACLEAEIKVVKPPFSVICGDCLEIEGPSGIHLTVLDLTKFENK